MDGLVGLVKSRLGPPKTGSESIIAGLLEENRLMRRVLSELTHNGPLYTTDREGPTIHFTVANGIITTERVTT